RMAGARYHPTSRPASRPAPRRLPRVRGVARRVTCATRPRLLRAWGGTPRAGRGAARGGCGQRRCSAGAHRPPFAGEPREAPYVPVTAVPGDRPGVRRRFTARHATHILTLAAGLKHVNTPLRLLANPDRTLLPSTCRRSACREPQASTGSWSPGRSGSGRRATPLGNGRAGGTGEARSGENSRTDTPP